LGLLINDLLDMEKLLAGKMPFDLQIYSLNGLIEQALKDNQSYADHLGVSFQYSNQIGPVNIHVDSLRFAQVMSNLLSNAAKFSPKGESVEILLLQQDDWVRIEVKDKGPGISDEFRKRIFQKFSQADSSDTRQKGGTGLGLAIVKELVDRMGGKVGYETEVGKGSCFFTVWKIVR
jgi:signal transduction histidine kinase